MRERKRSEIEVRREIKEKDNDEHEMAIKKKERRKKKEERRKKKEERRKKKEERRKKKESKPFAIS